MKVHFSRLRELQRRVITLKKKPPRKAIISLAKNIQCETCEICSVVQWGCVTCVRVFIVPRGQRCIFVHCMQFSCQLCQRNDKKPPSPPNRNSGGSHPQRPILFYFICTYSFQLSHLSFCGHFFMVGLVCSRFRVFALCKLDKPSCSFPDDYAIQTWQICCKDQTWQRKIPHASASQKCHCVSSEITRIRIIYFRFSSLHPMPGDLCFATKQCNKYFWHLFCFLFSEWSMKHAFA